MNDRDSLLELFEIVTTETQKKHLPMTQPALTFIRTRFGMGCDVYYRRRLSVCRMLLDLHLPVEDELLDILLAVTLSHWLPGDLVPEDHAATLERICGGEKRVAEILSVLRYEGEDYYQHLMENRYALLIRLTERDALVESLYEWSTADALRFIAETREHFFRMCIYAKEHYREFLGPVSVLMEKTRNLTAANEALLKRYEEADDALSSEILSLQEENAAIRAMILEIRGDAEKVQD